MKTADKKKLLKIRESLEGLRDRYEQEIQDARDTMQDTLDALQEQFDNLSERAQEGEKGSKLQAEIDAIQSAIDGDDLEAVIGGMMDLELD